MAGGQSRNAGQRLRDDFEPASLLPMHQHLRFGFDQRFRRRQPAPQFMNLVVALRRRPPRRCKGRENGGHGRKNGRRRERENDERIETGRVG